MAPASGHIESDVTEQVERLVETLIGISLVQQVDDIAATFFYQLLLNAVAYILYPGTIFLDEVQLFQLGVHRHKTAANPAIE
jgi:hypothetical protein